MNKSLTSNQLILRVIVPMMGAIAALFIYYKAVTDERFDEAKKNTDKLEAKVEVFTNRINVLDNTVDSLNIEILVTKKENIKLQEESKELSEQMERIESRYQAVMKELNITKKKYSQLKDQAEKKDEEIAKLQTTVDDLILRLENVGSELSSFKMDAAAKEAAYSKVKQLMAEAAEDMVVANQTSNNRTQKEYLLSAKEQYKKVIELNVLGFTERAENAIVDIEKRLNNKNLRNVKVASTE